MKGGTPVLRHFHLTRTQWKRIFKWSVYGLFFLALLMLQTVVSAKSPVFGWKLCFVPVLLVCVCIQEGPESGGLFVLAGTVVWCLSGADYGNLTIVVLTVCAILASVLCRAVLNDRLLSVWLCVLLSCIVNDSVIFVFKLILTNVAARNYWRVLLPGAGLSSLSVFVIYPLVRLIHRIGGSHGI